MDEALKKSSVWPNVALNPGTHEHAATGEPVEQPWWTRIGGGQGVVSYPTVVLSPEEVEMMKDAMAKAKWKAVAE